MVERQEMLGQINPVSPEEQPQEPSLKESFGGKAISNRRMLAVKIIDSMPINLNDKRLLFFYHLWHETRSLVSIKDLGEIREDRAVFSILDKVMESDELVNSYGTFYEEYLEKAGDVLVTPARRKRSGKKSKNLTEKNIPTQETQVEIQESAIQMSSKIAPEKKKLTLRESLVGKKGKLSKELTRVTRMINYLDITLEQKRTLFFYHLWHETGSFAPIKEFQEIRENPSDIIIQPVIENQQLSSAYEEFYKRLEQHRNKGRQPQTVDVAPKGRGQAISFEERLFELIPFRGKFTAREISQKTNYSEDYVRSVFKRAIKRNLIKPLDKRELAKRIKSKT